MLMDITKTKSHEIRLTPPLFIEVPQLNQKTEQSCIYMLGVSILLLFTNLFFDSVVFLVFHFFITNWIN